MICVDEKEVPARGKEQVRMKKSDMNRGRGRKEEEKQIEKYKEWRKGRKRRRERRSTAGGKGGTDGILKEEEGR